MFGIKKCHCCKKVCLSQNYIDDNVFSTSPSFDPLFGYRKDYIGCKKYCSDFSFHHASSEWSQGATIDSEEDIFGSLGVIQYQVQIRQRSYKKNYNLSKPH